MIGIDSKLHTFPEEKKKNKTVNKIAFSGDYPEMWHTRQKEQTLKGLQLKVVYQKGKKPAENQK